MLTKKEIKKIRGALLMLGKTYADIAREFHTSKQMVSMSIRRQRNSDLAKAIRTYVDELLAE